MLILAFLMFTNEVYVARLPQTKVFIKNFGLKLRCLRRIMKYSRKQLQQKITEITP